MIRTEFQADGEYFASPVYVRTAADELANALRCAQEDVEIARQEYVTRRRQIGMANKAKGIFGKMQKRMAFVMFNKARAALIRAEKALALAGME